MLTEDQITFYQENGYLVVPDVLDRVQVLEPVIREYSGILERLCAEWQAEGSYDPAGVGEDFGSRLRAAYVQGCDWFQPMDISLPAERITPETPFHIGPAVFDLLTNARLLDLVEDLIGSEITSNPIQHVRIKPPVGDLRPDEVRAHVAGTEWHQDRGVTHAEADNTDMITVWCAVSDATERNGCLQVVPGGHRGQMLPHCPGRGQLAIAPGRVDPAEAMPVPVGRGGVIILHPLTPHGSLENHSDDIRWSFDLRYNRTGHATGRSHFPEFVARSRRDPGSELHSWQVWRDMWLQARGRLAGVPHIDIHRWPADAPYCA